jgi:hypothetical protein
MVLRSVLFLALAAVAAGCGSPPAPSDVKTAPSPHSGASMAAPALNKIQTGAWRTIISYANVSGLPPALAHAMMSHPRQVEGCSTDGDINAAVHDAINGGGDMTCSANTLSAANGVIGGSAACHNDEGDAGTMNISGSYTSAHVDVSGDLSAHTQMGPVSEHIHWVSDHTANACASGNG